MKKSTPQEDGILKLENYYENPKVLHLGCEEPRAYYMPMNLEGKCEQILLNGEWEFAFYKSLYEVPEEFYLPENFVKAQSKEVYRNVQVPACWQYYGVDSHQYINQNYPIPYDPPYVPVENPCGAYCKNFTLDTFDGEKIYLNFEEWIPASICG